MSRPWLRVLLAVIAFALATVTATLARATADAASDFRARQAVWQRAVAPSRATQPGSAVRVGEALLGVGARSDVLRAYQSYRAGLVDVIPGTTYPQARARFEVVQRLLSLRGSLDGASDRASVDVVLGVVLADGAASAGQQRPRQLEAALAAFNRAVRGDPANPTAKLDLELLLRATEPRSKQDVSASGTPGKRKREQANPQNPTAPAREEGNGF